MPGPAAPDTERIYLCASGELVDGGPAVAFDVAYTGERLRAFAIRYRGRVHAYLNRCTHVPMEMDWQEGRFFDDTGRWLLCATHGASYEPDTGACASGPCRGSLVRVELSEEGGAVHWHTAPLLQPLAS